MSFSFLSLGSFLFKASSQLVVSDSLVQLPIIEPSFVLLMLS